MSRISARDQYPFKNNNNRSLPLPSVIRNSKVVAPAENPPRVNKTIHRFTLRRRKINKLAPPAESTQTEPSVEQTNVHLDKSRSQGEPGCWFSSRGPGHAHLLSQRLRESAPACSRDRRATNRAGRA